MRRNPLLFRPPSSAIDATRFTSTSPHAFSKPAPVRSSRPAASTFSPSASTSYTPQKPLPSLSSRSPPRSSNPNQSTTATATGFPPGRPPTAEAETPAQKVARLRAARAAAREQVQISTWDKIVVTGRAWVDRLHRVFTFGLIGLTVMAGLVSAYGTLSLITYNRRKRDAFYADQMRTQQELVIAAIQAEKAGLPMTEEQQLMLNREKARFQAEEARNSKPGFLKRLVAPMTGGSEAVADYDEGKEVGPMENAEAEAEGQGETVGRKGEGMVQAVRHGERVVEQALKETAEGNLTSGGKEAEAAVLGGFHNARNGATSTLEIFAQPVDQWAEPATETGKQKGDGWGS